MGYLTYGYHHDPAYLRKISIFIRFLLLKDSARKNSLSLPYHVFCYVQFTLAVRCRIPLLAKPDKLGLDKILHATVSRIQNRSSGFDDRFGHTLSFSN